MKQTPKTFKELFSNTDIKPTTDESGNTHYNFKASLKEEPKQKTLEEATEKKYGTSIYDFDQVDVFIEGAKWQQEKSYSEEEVLEILKLRLKWFRILPDEFEDNKWFEQFKKK